jgi:ketosteroid isomerase-like protein
MAEVDFTVADMLDREEIRDIVVRYFDAIWRDDIDAVVGLFAEDGTIVVRNGPLAGQGPVGRQQLHEFYVAGIKKMTPRPFAHNHVVDLHGHDRATGRVYVELRSSVDYSWLGAVIYVDEYVKRRGRWMIHRREVHMQNMG